MEEGKEDTDNPQPGPFSLSTKKKAQFVANKGWFAKFQKRYGLKSVPMHGEAAYVDKGAAKEYIGDPFQDIINEEKYIPEQDIIWTKTAYF